MYKNIEQNKIAYIVVTFEIHTIEKDLFDDSEEKPWLLEYWRFPTKQN